jgi:transaldolase
MPQTYFQQLNRETPTRVWVNNPTIAEMDLALEQGARGSTTNPAYGGNLLRRAPDEILPIIAECVRLADDDLAVADLVQQRLVGRITERFLPLFEQSGGTAGFVSIQGAPERDTDAHHILAEAHDGHAIAPNATPKIPATTAGLAAFETLVAEGCPTIVTEVFSLDQLVETCERYLRASAAAGTRPPFFMSPITGILGDHLKAVAMRDGIEIPAADMELAGVALSRECYRLVKERGYPVTLLCGGSRIPFDLTGLVGADLHATINWSTFAEVLESDEPFAQGFGVPIGAEVLARLEASFDVVRQAMHLGSLTVDQFEEFGPVRHFRDNFIGGWNAVLAAIAEARTEAVRA